MPESPPSEKPTFPPESPRALGRLRSPAAVVTSPEVLTLLVLGLGVLARTREWLHGRSLWFDEAMLSLNIIERPFLRLFKPLDMGQAAPPGFAVLDKFIAGVGGYSETSLRFVPLVAGLAALLLFCGVARRLLSRSEAAVATALFALSPWLIRYSNEVKQYSVEVLVTVTLLALAARIATDAVRRRDVVAMTLVGILAPWVSFPGIFVLVGMVGILLLRAVHRRNPRLTLMLIGGSVLWIASFLLLYFSLLSKIRGSAMLLGYWQDRAGFAPLVPFSAAAVRWYHDFAFGVFADPVGIPASALALLLFLVGVREMWKRDPWMPSLLMGPVVVALAASAVRVYPIEGRTALYLAPLLIIPVARGVGFMLASLRWVGILSVAILVVSPLALCIDALGDPFELEELRPVLAQVEHIRRFDEPLVLYYGADPAFRYYVKEGVIDAEGSTVLGSWEQRQNWQREAIARISTVRQSARRFWLVFSHVYTQAGVDEEQLLTRAAMSCGVELRRIHKTGATAVLISSADSAGTDCGR